VYTPVTAGEFQHLELGSASLKFLLMPCYVFFTSFPKSQDAKSLLRPQLRRLQPGVMQSPVLVTPATRAGTPKRKLFSENWNRHVNLSAAGHLQGSPGVLPRWMQTSSPLPAQR